MKKNLILFIIFATGLIVGIVATFLMIKNNVFTGGINRISSPEEIKGTDEFSSLEKNLTELSKDTDFYRHTNVYMSLLSDEDFKHIKETTERYEESKEFEYLGMLVILNELFKDEKIKNIITDLKNMVFEKTKKELTKEEQGDLFEKNNACANLITGIKEQLQSI